MKYLNEVVNRACEGVRKHWKIGLAGLAASLILAYAPICGKTDYNTGRSLYEQGDYERAIIHLKQVHASSDDFGKAQDLLQNTYYELGRRIYLTRQINGYDDAIGYLKQVGESNPNYQEANRLLKRLYDMEIRSLKRKMGAPSYGNKPVELQQFRRQIEIYERELNTLIGNPGIDKQSQHNPPQPSSQGPGGSLEWILVEKGMCIRNPRVAN